ncbi:ribonuclease HII [Agrococcus jejuensis]|uniref:ribonuclease HII n=1 Tax=Agrococcus jejuensis TaxID=399736 RepID=UPI0011AB1204|nr:ribonuclease HII [Agrococcus jejuensis]
MTVDPTLEVETGLWDRRPLVIGMDEVGRGALAGPVSVGAFALTRCDVVPEGLRDSKAMTAKARERTAPIVREWGIAAVGHASAAEIDAVGIMAALAIAGRRALEELHAAGVDVVSSALLLDGSHDWLSPRLRRPLAITLRPKADRDCGSVAGAACVAKVERDALMVAHDAEHPGYGWASNKGYAAAVHMDAIRTLGATRLHRRTWLKSDGAVRASAAA